MQKAEDPRLDATRTNALNAALTLLQENGVLAVTHASVSANTGISRSTLYRHWPKLDALRYAVFAHAAVGPAKLPPITGPLRDDLKRILSRLMTALNETPWGKVAPQLVAAAATDQATRDLLNQWMADRSNDVNVVFNAAVERGEIAGDTSVDQVIEMAIGIPYFKKLIAGRELDDAWLDGHVEMICGLVSKND